MYAAPGIGLAAPQVGELKRVIVLDIDREDVKTGPLFMANPEIVEASDEDVTYEEGCLSVPEHYSDVARPAKVTVRYLDRDGKQQEWPARACWRPACSTRSTISTASCSSTTSPRSSAT